MDIYIKLFEVLFPVFFVVGIGYYLGKKNPKIDTTFITNFAANVGTPAMIIYALNPVNISFTIFINYFWYYAIAIVGFIIVGIIILFLLNTKDIIRELPPLTMPNTGNMGLPICLFAYGSQGLGVSAAISALIILCHFTLGVFLADRKFSLQVILKSPPFYAIIIAVFLLYYDYELPGFIRSLTLDVPEESPWEIGINNEGLFDNTVKEMPHICKVTGLTFTPIHTFRPSIVKLTNPMPKPEQNLEDNNEGI